MSMKPDLTDYDTLDVIALKRADIPIGLCDGKVRAAMKQALPRWDIAEFFLLQLKTAIELNKIDYIVDEDRGRLRPEYFVHTDILNNWPELEYPPIPWNVADYLKEREGQSTEPTPTPQEFIRRRLARKIKNELNFPKNEFDFTQNLKKRNAKSNFPDAVNDSRATSKDLMLGISARKNGLFDPNDERRGKQADAVRFFQEQMAKVGLTGQYLSESTIKKNLKAAMDALKEYAILDKEDDT